MKSDSASIDIRVQQFLWLFPFGLLFHGMLWIARRGLSEYPTELEAQAWTPGMFMSVGSNLWVNWILWYALAVYLPFGKYKRSAAAALSVVTVLHFFHLFTRVPNHFLLIMIPVFLLAICRNDDRDGTPALIPMLRSLVTITYLFAAVHKLNPYYFSAASPAIPLFRTLMTNLDIQISTSVLIGFAVLGIVTEFLIPIFLVNRRWRPLGFYLGFMFHGVIAGTGAADYSVVICALYPVFLEKDEARRVLELLRQFDWIKALTAFAIGSTFTFFCFFPLDLTGFSHSNNGQTGAAFLPVLGSMVFYAYCAVALLPWLMERLPDSVQDSHREPDVYRQGTRIALAVFVLFYSLNCLTPYVGLKYYFSQTMFSGLKQSATNHYFIPRVRLFENDRYVRIRGFEIGGIVPMEHKNKVDRITDRIRRHRLLNENYFSSFLENACQHSQLRPIRFSYRFRNEDLDRSIADACAEDTGLRKSYPFNLYKRHPREQ